MWFQQNGTRYYTDIPHKQFEGIIIAHGFDLTNHVINHKPLRLSKLSNMTPNVSYKPIKIRCVAL